MSFDVHFIGSEGDQRGVDELRRLIDRAFDNVGSKVVGSDWRQVTVRSGWEFEWSAPRSDTENRRASLGGCAYLRGFDIEIARCLFEIARLTNWVMIPALKDVRTVRVANRPDPISIPHLPEVLDVSTVEEFFAYLCSGFEGWRTYRDQVVREKS